MADVKQGEIIVDLIIFSGFHQMTNRGKATAPPNNKYLVHRKFQRSRNQTNEFWKLHLGLVWH